MKYLLGEFPSTFDVERNWTSSLRGYARSFKDFKDLPDYNHREISDITYDDADGEMTRWLIERGYDQAENWLDRPPRYHIEVKTTTGDCSDRFYMSTAQAQHVSHPQPKRLLAVTSTRTLTTNRAQRR